MNVIQCSNNPYYALFLVWMKKSFWWLMLQRLAFLCCVATISIYFPLEDEGSVRFSSVTQSCPTLCDPMNRSRQGFPVHHQHPELSKLMSIESVMPSSHLILCHPLTSCPQSLPASGSFPVSQLFTWDGQSIEVSALASVLPMNTQDCSPLEGTGWTSLPSITCA